MEICPVFTSRPDTGRRTCPASRSWPDTGHRTCPVSENMPDTGRRTCPVRENMPDTGRRTVRCPALSGIRPDSPVSGRPLLSMHSFHTNFGLIRSHKRYIIIPVLFYVRIMYPALGDTKPSYVLAAYILKWSSWIPFASKGEIFPLLHPSALEWRFFQ